MESSSLDDPLPSLSFAILLFQQLPLEHLIIGLVVLMILLILSGLVSGSEVAFFSLQTKELVEMKKEDQTQEKIISLLKHPRRLLATILILNNFINVAIVTISTYLTWMAVGTKDLDGILLTGLTFVITLLIVFFGEVVPKIYANQRNILFARISMTIISPAFVILRPLAWLLTSLSNVIEKRIEKHGYQASLDEIKTALEITTQVEATEEEKGILQGIVNFGQLTVKQVMISRVDITAFDYEMNFHELMDKINKTGFSRIPVYKDTIDSIQGILYNKDMLPYVEEDETFDWRKLLRPSYFVPENKKIDSLLKDFQEKRVHMAIVVDEYGGTSGLITLEDIIEEIVGEINDEFDDEDVIYSKINENTYVFESKTSLNDFCKITNQDPEIFEPVKGESESLGGLLLEINKKLPRAGEQIYFDKFVFTVVSVDKRKIKRVRVLIKDKNVAI